LENIPDEENFFKFQKKSESFQVLGRGIYFFLFFFIFFIFFVLTTKFVDE